MSDDAPDALRTRLLLLNRGAVDWAAAEEGDPPLSEEGLAEAEMAAAALLGFDAVFSRPMRAAVETAEAVAAARALPVTPREGLAEIAAASPPCGEADYCAWVDRLFDSYGSSPDGESLADGAARLARELRAIGDMRCGRASLVVSHPLILLAFCAEAAGRSLARDLVDALPDLAAAAVDYVEGRFYLVEEFPVRR